MSDKNVYELKLHERTIVDFTDDYGFYYDVLRVPSGWIYQRFDETTDGVIGSNPVFVQEF